MSTLIIRDILNGYRVDMNSIQSAGNMTVLPIVADAEFTNVADINDVKLTKDVQYNQLEFSNSSGQVAITIQGWTIIDGKQAAQDRTTPYAHLIKGTHNKMIPVKKVLPANCVQAHQPGLFDVGRWQQENFMILPPSLRGIALKVNRNYRETELSQMWESLRGWVTKVDCKEQGLQMFYSKFKDTLDDFVAEFEPVKNQLGAAVFINGNLVSIDLFPKYATWKSVWRALIRDSYGAEAIRVKENQGAQETVPVIDLSKVTDLASLRTEYDAAKSDFYEALQRTLGEVLETQVDHAQQEQINELTMLKIEHTDWQGQAVLHGDRHFVYLSLARTTMEGRPLQRFRSRPLQADPYANRGFRFN